MANDTQITVCGNLTSDPELRYSPSGDAVANFTIASTPRTFNRQSNEWVDGEPLFLRCSIWREAAENVAQSLTKGMRVIAEGYLKMRQYDDKKTGEKRTSTELEVQEIGPSMRYATAQVNRTQRNNPQNGTQQAQGGFGGQQAPAQGNGGNWGGQQQSQPPAQAQQAAQQPWGGQQAPAQQQDQQAGGWGNGADTNATPF